MSEIIRMQRCNPCQVAVMPSQHGTTRFPCPSCGMIPIIRCERCRKLGNRYTCPNCGFSGP
ncbi:MAG: zinc finger domain-containing protein [Promethearchaeota archaeon]